MSIRWAELTFGRKLVLWIAYMFLATLLMMAYHLLGFVLLVIGVIAALAWLWSMG